VPASITLPFIPPSTNNAYFQKGHHRVLSAKSRKFKNEVRAYIAKEYPWFLSYFKKDVPYTLMVNFNVERKFLLSKTWPEKATARYKKWDASNRVKLLEDTICDTCGYDDSQHHIVVASKVVKPEGEGSFTEVWVFNLEEEDCPVDNFIGQQPR